MQKVRDAARLRRYGRIDTFAAEMALDIAHRVQPATPD
jgi:hypothetical protein